MSIRLLALSLSFSAAVASAAFAAEPFSEPPQLDKPQAGYYRLKIGKVDVIAVSDGAAAFDILSIVPNEKKEAAARIMAKPNATRIEASIGGGIRGACFAPRPLLGKPPIPEFART